MRVGRLAAAATVGVVAAILVPSAMAAKKPPKLVATFGPGLTFDVKRGKKVLSSGSNGTMAVKARAYRLVVMDDSALHNFRLVNARGTTIRGKRGAKRPKVVTSVPGTRQKPTTFVVNLKKGVYTLVCDPHRAVGMTVTINVR